MRVVLYYKKQPIEFLIDEIDYPIFLENTYSAVYRSGKFYMYCVKTATYFHRAVICPLGNWIIDHIDGDSQNNQKSNLRLCSRKENHRNRLKSSNNKSGYKGVHFEKQTHKYKAAIGYNNKHKNIVS